MPGRATNRRARTCHGPGGAGGCGGWQDQAVGPGVPLALAVGRRRYLQVELVLGTNDTLVTPQVDEVTLVYTPDADGARVTKYYYFGGQRIAMRADGVVYYLHGDHLGSTSLVTTGEDRWVGIVEVPAGSVWARQLYHSYGTVRYAEGTLPTDFGFTGQRKVAGTGLMYYKARYYYPGLGRFVSADTVVPNPGVPGDLNRYAYVRNNPCNLVDPSGHCTIEGDSAVCDEFARLYDRATRWGRRPVFRNPPADPNVFGNAREQGFGNTQFAFNNQALYANLSGLHNGIDIGMPIGTDLVAMDYGVVAGIDIWGAGPHSILIRHGDYVVLYGHLLLQSDLDLGDVVEPGDVVGQSGTSNNFDHLHLEIRWVQKGRPIDAGRPARWMHNPLYFFGPGVPRDMDIQWQDYVDVTGQVDATYNELSMYAYHNRGRQGSFWNNTLPGIVWARPDRWQRGGPTP